VALRAIFADWLAFALFSTKQIDQWLAKNESKNKSREKRSTGTKRDVSEKVEYIAPIGQFGQPIKHVSPLVRRG
jgi:hypothetical protein